MAGPDRLGPRGEEKPSHKAIDNGNPAIFHPKWLVLDDINVDLISFVMLAATIPMIFLGGVPGMVAIPAILAFLIPFRMIFPRVKTPEGLVLITGASSGIGAELTYIFAEKGHDLVLVGRNEEQLEAVKNNVIKINKTGKKVYTIATDLSVPGSAKQLYDHIVEKGFQVDVLVNGAGLGGAGDTLDQPIELAERMTHLNCISLVQLSQLFGRDMAKRGKGWMLQISSVGGKMHMSRTSEDFVLTSRRLDCLPSPKHLPRIQTLRPRLLRSPLPRNARLQWSRKHATHARSYQNAIRHPRPRRRRLHVRCIRSSGGREGCRSGGILRAVQGQARGLQQL